MTEWLATFQRYHAGEILLIAAAALILIDYFFATDWPAHIGYLCVAMATFVFVWEGGLNAPAVTWGTGRSLLLAGGVWIGMVVLHQLLFRRYLENAPGTPGYDAADDSQVEEGPEAAGGETDEEKA